MYHSFLIHSSIGGHLGCVQHLAIVNHAAVNIGDADTGPQCLWCYGWDETNSHGLQKCCGGKGMTQRFSQWEDRPHPLPGQAFIAFFLGTLHYGWSSFTMHRFTLGGYLLQKTKERMLLVTSKKEGYLQMYREKWLNWLHSSLGGLA